jgi:hypothetical protein
VKRWAIALLALAVPAAILSTTAAQANTHTQEKCVRKVSHNGPGITRYGLKVYEDSCGQPIRAAAYCHDEDIFGIQWWKWYYGNVVHGPRSKHGKMQESYANCTLDVISFKYGGEQHKVRVNGKWIYTQLWSNNIGEVPNVDFACPNRSVCLYEGNKLNGPHPLVLPVTDGGLASDSPFNLIDNAGGHAGSVRDRPGVAAGDLWVLRRSPHRVVHCIKAGGWRSLYHRYGTGYLLTPSQSSGCHEHAPNF